MTTYNGYIHYGDEDSNEVKDAIKNVFDKMINLKKVRIQIKPSNKILKHLKSHFSSDVKHGDLEKVTFGIASKGLHPVINMDVTYRDDKPCLIGLNQYSDMTDVHATGKDYWDQLMKLVNTKVINFEMLEWMDNSTAAVPTEPSRKGPVHTEEWNKNIGDARRGMKYKTAATEGITWHYEGSKKVML
jgi:hypothetical protein